MTLSDKISSIRTTLNADYTKPSKDKMVKFMQDLKSSAKAQEYLRKRGLSMSTAKNFHLGYDKERNAIAIPIVKNKELINIRYRLLEPQGSVKYTQERGCEVWMFNEDGIDIGLKKGGVLIVEGEIDCMSAWQAGFKNVVSPASGKDSYAPWIELLDNIPKTYICYDNDKPGKLSAKKLADRIGIEKCLEIFYPDDVNDANEFFSKYDRSDFIKLIKEARPFYKYKFSSVGDVLTGLKDFKEEIIKSKYLPFVEMEEDWVVVLSARSNTGKTSLAVAITNEFADKEIPTLILPYERGIRTVGRRLLQNRFEMTSEDFNYLTENDWKKMIKEVVNLPIYFSLPTPSETLDIIKQGKRIFDIKVVVVDHFDLLIRKSDGNKNENAEKMLMQLKELAQEKGIIFLLVHHIRKQVVNSEKPKRPVLEDLKGIAALYQDPEVVAMLHPRDEDKLEIIIEKNKGAMGYKIFDFDKAKCVIKEEEKVDESVPSKEQKEEMDKLWNQNSQKKN